MNQALIDTFGVGPFGLLALATIHFHLFLIGRRLARVEATPTVQRELTAHTK